MRDNTSLLSPSERLHACSEPAVLLDDTHRILEFNAAFAHQYPGDRSPLGRRCHEVSHASPVPCSDLGHPCPMEEARHSGRVERALHIHAFPDGERHVAVEALPLLDSEGRQQVIETIRAVPFAHARPSPVGLTGRSPAFRRMLEMLLRVAPQPYPVLLQGETGTGKELVARAIHEASPRRKGPFVPVECSGLSEHLFESELFGHRKGAYTGAYEDKAGLVETARGGTLFLDEVGEIPLRQQVKLLRVIESLSFRRVGETRTRLADFRLICASNRELYEMMVGGSFRPDLYFRISALPLRLPPLRERRDDISLIARSILARIAGPEAPELTAAGLARLHAHPFPGNIRELQNMLEQATLLADGHPLGAECFEDPAHGPDHRLAALIGDDPNELPTLKEMERRYIAFALSVQPDDRERLARRLGVSLRTLYRKLGRHRRS